MMKRRMLSLLLALILAMSVLPLAASADITIEGYVKKEADGTSTKYIYADGTYYVVNDEGKIIGGTAKDSGSMQKAVIGKSKAELDAAKHEHEYHWTTTRGGHMYICECEDHFGFVRHDDPTVSSTGYCSCGYKYLSNADLSVLWFTDIRLDTPFNKDKTEYTGKTVAWKDVTETKLTARAADVRATLELPEDLTLKQGTNTFTIKVTAEDGVTAKTYTFSIEKP